MTAELRELLELAAQAAGVEVERIDCHLYIKGTTVCWNPLESGDDLIDLMEKRSMAITWVDSFDEVICWILHGVGNENVTATEKISDHPTRKAALAMAVLRCAAEIGRRM